MAKKTVTERSARIHVYCEAFHFSEYFAADLTPASTCSMLKVTNWLNG